MEDFTSIIINKLDDKPTFFYYKDDFLNDTDLDFLYNLNYKEGNYERNDEQIKVSRKQLWFQTENKYFCPIWKKRLNRWESELYFEKLYSIQNKVQKFIDELNIFNNSKINSCLINYYETGNNFIPAHKDSSLSFGEYPTIVCISHGDNRTMVLKNKDEHYSFNLKSNSIFIMSGSSQKYYTHEIEKKPNGVSRYSLTFRHFIL